MISDEAIEAAVTARVYLAYMGDATPEEAAKEIMDVLNPTIWPRRAPSYGTTGTRRTRRGRK